LMFLWEICDLGSRIDDNGLSPPFTEGWDQHWLKFQCPPVILFWGVSVSFCITRFFMIMLTLVEKWLMDEAASLPLSTSI
jgi:hypothetical protein